MESEGLALNGLYFVAHLYTDGRQPCDRFAARDELADRGVRGNVHECFGPYIHDGLTLVRDRSASCSGHVSFCEACMSDHHTGGWDTCGAAS